MKPFQKRFLAPFLTLVFLGCGTTQLPSGSGARETVKGFFEALLRKDWPQAYSSLEPKSRKQVTSEDFIRQAEAYGNHLGFDTGTVLIRSCQEQGNKAVAHVVLTGQTQSKNRRFKDAVTLHRNQDQWGIVLSPQFGKLADEIP